MKKTAFAVLLAMAALAGACSTSKKADKPAEPVAKPAATAAAPAPVATPTPTPAPKAAEPAAAASATPTPVSASLKLPTPEPVMFVRGAKKPPIVTAAEWKSEPHTFPDSYIHTPKNILIHHEGAAKWKATDDPIRKVKNLQDWGYTEKKWNDVPYHFLIAPDGRIIEGRSVKYKPDTNTKFDTTGFINVELLGNFEQQRVSLKQMYATVALVAWLSQEYKIDPSTILTHKDAAPGQTDCPGKDFYRYFAQGPFKTWVRIAQTGKTPPIKLLPADPAGPTEMIPGEDGPATPTPTPTPAT